MEADRREQRLRELEAENAALRAQVQTLTELTDQLRQQNRKLQDRIEELKRAALPSAVQAHQVQHSTSMALSK